jgi:DNA gyrase subunit A
MAKVWRSPLVEEMLRRAASDAARPDGLPPEFGWHADATPPGYRLVGCAGQAILELRLQRLTGLEQDKIFGEYKEVMAQIVDLLDILAKPGPRDDDRPRRAHRGPRPVRRRPPLGDRRRGHRSSRSRT